jgi:hypothetical protein
MRILKKELWPHKITMGVNDSTMDIDKIETWLGEYLGAFKTSWNAVYHYNSTDFYFRTGEDALLFKLKWS